MTGTVLDQRLPMSDEEFLALRAPERVELLDGALWIRNADSPRHQHISRRLADALGSEDLHVLEAAHLRLRPARILVPDVVVTSAIDVEKPAVGAEAALLVGEIVPPWNVTVTKILKMHYYAEAGIPWLLIAYQETGALHLYQLEERHYVERSVTKVGEVLHLLEPVDVIISPEELLPPG